MVVLIKIGIFFLNIIYFFIKLFPINNNKVSIISRQSDKKSVDIKILEKELKKENIEVVVLCKKVKNKFKYLLYMFKQMYHIATSKVVILDGYCIVVSILKQKKDTKIIQMWHALGAFKKFGCSVVGQEEGANEKIAKAMNMHKNYDYVLASGEGCIKAYCEAFNVGKKKIKILPLPRVDLLKDKDNIKKVKKDIFEEYPKLKNKKNILYAPTFKQKRSKLYSSEFKESNSLNDRLNELIDSIDYSKYNLIIKLHPLSKTRLVSDKAIIDKKFTTQDMMHISDYIITDYSAIIFEASVLSKPIYFWVYDYDEYVNKRNFYLDFDKDLPGFKSKNIDTIVSRIENDIYDYKKLREFQKKYVSVKDTKAIDEYISFIKELQKK